MCLLIIVIVVVSCELSTGKITSEVMHFDWQSLSNRLRQRVELSASTSLWSIRATYTEIVHQVQRAEHSEWYIPSKLDL